MAQKIKVETTRELRTALAALVKEQKILDASIEQRSEEIKELVAAQETDEEAHRSLEYKIARTTTRLFTHNPIKPEVVVARMALIANLQLSQSEEITVATQRALKMEIQKGLSALQALCEHPLVFSYDGYGGSQSYDYDDQYPGHRICTFCNLREDSASTANDVYTTLDENGTRLALRDLREKKDLPGPLETEWFSIKFIQRLFEASAGDHNIRWPEVVESKDVLKG